MGQLNILKQNQLSHHLQKMPGKQEMDLIPNVELLMNIMLTQHQKYMMLLNRVWEQDHNL